MASILIEGLKLAIKPLLKLPKRKIAEAIIDSGKFSYSNILKSNKKFSTSFDDAYKLAGGKKYTPTESGKIAAAGKKKLYEADPLRAKAEYEKISKKFLDDIESGKRISRSFFFNRFF